MRKLTVFLLVSVMLNVFTGITYADGAKTILSTAEAVLENDYLMGPGDVLYISVWKDEALSQQITVLPDGMISFPLAGDIRASGKTVAMLRAVIKKKLDKYISDPVVSVGIIQVNSLMIYVIGKVYNPGRFVLNTYIDVMQALSMAGGLNPFAKDEEIKIFRKSGNKTEILDFNYEIVSEGENLSGNIQLQRGDVIVVP